MKFTIVFGRPRRLPLLAAAAFVTVGVSAGRTAAADMMLEEPDRARIAREVARLDEASGYAFFIVEDTATHKYVQFAADDGSVLVDFPVLQASNGVKEPFRDASCGARRLTVDAGETEVRLRPVEEERLVESALRASHVPPAAVYCVQVTQRGTRHGYGMSIRGRLKDPVAVVALIERVFLEVYGIKTLEHPRFVTDQDR